MKHKKIYLLVSGLILLPGIISLGLFGLKLDIDFTGGTVSTYNLGETEKNDEEVKRIIETGYLDKEVEVEKYLKTNNQVELRTRHIDSSLNDEVIAELKQELPNISQESFDSVGPSIGRQTTKNAFLALMWASVGILAYIAFAFRNIPKPYSSIRFGVSALVAMLHDALLLLGVFSILGWLFKIEIDALFITAVLTVIGFSIHDSIVVFDRIRENLKKLPSSWSFEKVVNFSVVETLNRSFATSLTVLITLLSLYLLGGQSIRNFVLALLIGIISGTYSSIFTASPLLVLWEDFVLKRSKKKSKK